MILRPAGLAACAVVLFALALGGALPNYWVTLIDYIGIGSLVALGLVLLTGVGGMTSFGQAAFVGFGAYTTSTLTLDYGWSPWATLPAALATTALGALFVGLVTVRLSGHYLSLSTIAWGLSFFYIFGNMEALGGHDGLSGIPPLRVGAWELADPRGYLLIVAVFVIVALVATRNLLDSRTGRAIRALRRGAVAAEAFGVATARVKLVVFVYAAVLAGASGWLYAHFQRSVSAGAFGVEQNFEYMLMAVVGGAGRIPGALLGAATIIVLRDQLQNWLPLLFGSAGNYETIVFGAILVLVLQTAPQGLWPLIAGPVKPNAPAGRGEREDLPSREKVAADVALLDVQAARKTFGGLVAVNDVSFRVGGREIVGLIGPNGAGKSTTFNLLTGIAPADAGRILFRGEEIGREKPGGVARRGIARSFQHVHVVAEMSVLENVALGAHLRGRAGAWRAMLRLDRTEEARIFDAARAALAQVGLAGEAMKPAGSLALGPLRLLEIARALALDPLLLLLDEPAAGLRVAEKRALAALLRGLRAGGVSVLLVEHDMDFVMSLADRLVVLDFGAKISEGAPSAVRRDPRVLDAYLGGVA